MGFEVYRDKGGEWRGRLRTSNGQLVASGGEGFASKSSVIRSLESVRRLVASSPDHVELDAEGKPKE